MIRPPTCPGNRDRYTNGIPIGPVVSDIVAEMVLGAVDRELSKAVRESDIECTMTRFKDDYRFLVSSEADGRRLLKLLQVALREYNLELGEGKTSIHTLPEGLFRPWVSHYLAAHPRSRRYFSWKRFRELYLAVLRIDKTYPGTGVIDRFLADIVTKEGELKVRLSERTLQKTMSMLLMLGARRIKAFPKVIAIIESVYGSDFGVLHADEIVEYLESFLITLAEDETRNKYLISWIAYFLVSNRLAGRLTKKPKLLDPITRSVFNNRPTVFKSCTDFKLFEGCVTAGKRVSMLEHLDIFNPPMPT